MNAKTISGGFRGFSMLEETAFGTPQTVDTSLNFAATAEPFDDEPGKLWDDKEENTGEIAPTKQQIISMKSGGKHDQNLMPHNAALFLSWLTGKCVTTNPSDAKQATVRKHLISTDKAVIDLKSRTVREYDGYSCQEYPGVVCSEVDISGARDDFVKLTATLLGMGKATLVTPTPERPAQVLESYLLYGDCKIKTGGTYDGDDVTGGTDISARVMTFKCSLKNGAKLNYLFGDPTGFAGQGRRGRMIDCSLEMTLEFEDAGEKAALLACTYFVLEIPIIGTLIGESTTNYFTVRLVFPKLAYNKAKRGVSDGLLMLNAGFTVFADTTYGPVHIHVTNEQTGYLAS